MKINVIFCVFAILKISNAATINHELVSFEISNAPNKYLTEADIIEVKNPPFSEFSEITAQLYHTTLGGINGTNLIKHHIGCVFDLAHEYKYELPNGSNIFHFEYKNILDETSDNMKDAIYDIVTKMQRCVNHGRNIVAHCVGGASRSGTVIAAFLIKHEGLSLKRAFLLAKERRPIFRPNNGFMKQLIRFEKSLGREPSVKMVTEKRDNLVVEEPDFMRVYFPQILDEDYSKQYPPKEQTHANTVIIDAPDEKPINKFYSETSNSGHLYNTESSSNQTIFFELA